MDTPGARSCRTLRHRGEFPNPQLQVWVVVSTYEMVSLGQSHQNRTFVGRRRRAWSRSRSAGTPRPPTLMTVLALSLSSLRAAKNAAIGNPLAKLQLVRDQVFISRSVRILNPPSLLTPALKDCSTSSTPNMIILPKMPYE